VDCFDSIAREIGEFYKTMEVEAEEGAADKSKENDEEDGEDKGGKAKEKGKESKEDDVGTGVGAGAGAGSEDQPHRTWKWMVEHRIYPALRGMFQPPRSLSTNATIVQVADLHQLYKVFERC
jgi:DNA mismatch repair protein MLH1